MADAVDEPCELDSATDYKGHSLTFKQMQEWQCPPGMCKNVLLNTFCHIYVFRLHSVNVPTVRGGRSVDSEQTHGLRGRVLMLLGLSHYLAASLLPWRATVAFNSALQSGGWELRALSHFQLLSPDTVARSLILFCTITIAASGGLVAGPAGRHLPPKCSIWLHRRDPRVVLDGEFHDTMGKLPL